LNGKNLTPIYAKGEKELDTHDLEKIL